MLVRGYEISLKTVYEECGKSTPGDDFVREIIQRDSRSLVIFDSRLTRRQSTDEFVASRGAYLMIAKDRDTLLKCLAGHDGKIKGFSSFSLIWGGYGGSGFARWRAGRRGIAAAKEFYRQTRKVLDLSSAKFAERAYYILALSRVPALDERVMYPGYAGDANINFINATGGLYFKSLAYLMNNNKEVNFKLKWKKDKFVGTDAWENRADDIF